MKLLVLGLLPIILLSLLRLHQWIIYVVIGLPVLIIWISGAILVWALMPRLSSDSGK